jgi:hypothetical protein
MPSNAQLAQARRRLSTLRQAECTVGAYREQENLTTLKTDRVLVEQHYSGTFKLRSASGAVSARDIAGQQVAVQDVVLSLDVDSSGSVTEDDVVVITKAPRDPALVGLELRIAGIHPVTDATARRFPVEVIS